MLKAKRPRVAPIDYIIERQLLGRLVAEVVIVLVEVAVVVVGLVAEKKGTHDTI